MLTQVLLFCKLTASEAPQTGIVKAVQSAWDSAEFQAVAEKGQHDRHSAPEGTISTSLTKIFGTLWVNTFHSVPPAPLKMHCPERIRIWTPQELDEPPGRPPSVV